MTRALPFAALGLIGLLGLLQTPTAGALEGEGVTTTTTPEDPDASVRVDARLESTRLLAGADVETYARVVLEGKDLPARQERLPLSLTLVIDQSGSMTGDKIESARRSALRLLEELETGDRVSVVAFSSGARVLVPSLTVGYGGSLEHARRTIEELRAVGGTDMVAGLDAGASRARALYGDGRVNRLLLLSDGQPDTEDGLKERVKALAQSGIQTTTLGVGRDYNEDLMARLADAGLGNYHFIESPSQMAHIFTRELESLASVVAKEAVVTLGAKGGARVLEVFGWETSGQGELVSVPVGDVYGGKRAELLVRLRVPAGDAAEERALLDVKVSFHDALSGAVRRVERPLVATFTSDERAVKSARDLAVTAKAEEVRTAVALQEASTAYKRGDHASARRIYTEQKQRVQTFASGAGAAYAPAAAEMAAALDDLDEAAEGDVSVASKKAKARARSMMR